MGWPLGFSNLDGLNIDEFKDWEKSFLRDLTHVCKKRKTKKMQTMRNNDEPEAVQHWSSRKQFSIQKEKILQPFLCEQTPRNKTGHLAIQVKKNDAENMCCVRFYGAFTSPPYRREQKKFECIQPSNIVHPLPQISSRYGKEAWFNGSWENGVPRVAGKLENRSNRLAAIGDGQLPIVAAFAFEYLRAVIERQ